jgi:hypothetical protein
MQRRIVRTFALSVIAALFVTLPCAIAAEKTKQGAMSSATSAERQGIQQQKSQQSGQSSEVSTTQMYEQREPSMALTIKKVDKQNHMLTLRSDAGETFEVKVREEMLADVEVGDTVTLSIDNSPETPQSMRQKDLSG